MTRVTPRTALVAFYALVASITLVMAFPIVWVVLSSLKPAAEAMRVPPTWLPSRLSVENYAALQGIGSGLLRHVWNSFAVAVGSAVAVAALAALAGYGFARFAFAGRQVVFVLLLATLMVPFQIMLMPLFVVLRQLELHNSLLGLGLVYTTFHLPLGIFIMRNAFESVPRELDEAATIDGAGHLVLLRRVLLPVVAPSVVTVLLVNFITCWNEFLGALILMTQQANYTLPVMLVNLQFGYMGVVDWGALQAGTVVTMLPPLLLTLAFQRYYVQGLVGGATKG